MSHIVTEPVIRCRDKTFLDSSFYKGDNSTDHSLAFSRGVILKSICHFRGWVYFVTLFHF